MTPDQFRKFMEGHEARTARRAMVLAATEALIVMFRIRRQGRELVYLLAKGRGKDNYEALQSWVSEQVPAGALEDLEILAPLKRRLGLVLMSFQEVQ